MKSEEKEEAWGEEEEETRRMNSLRMQEDCFLGRIFKQREKHVQKTKLAVTRQIEKTGKERWRPKAMAVSWKECDAKMNSNQIRLSVSAHTHTGNGIKSANVSV